MDTCFEKSLLFKTTEGKLVLSCDDDIKPNGYDLPTNARDVEIAQVLSVVLDSSTGTKALVQLSGCTDLGVGDKIRISKGVVWPEIVGQIKRVHKSSNLILLEI